MKVTVRALRVLLEGTGDVSWVSPDGKKFSVTSTHDEWARQYMIEQGTFGKNTPSPKQHLIKNGWVAHDQDFFGGLHPSFLSRATRAKLINIVKNARGDAPEYWSYTPGNWSFTSSDNEGVKDAESFIRWIMES